MYTERHVVTCFLTSMGRILLLKRSDRVSYYQGRWAGVSGSVIDDPMAQAVREITEETGLLPSQHHLVRQGPPIVVTDDAKKMRWQVHPFLFHVDDPGAVRLSWEHTEHRWVDPRKIGDLEIVPMLQATLERVWDEGELDPSNRMPAPVEEEHPPSRPGLPIDPALRRDALEPEPSKATEDEHEEDSTPEHPPEEPARVELEQEEHSTPEHPPEEPARVELEQEEHSTPEHFEFSRHQGIRVRVVRKSEFPTPELKALPVGKAPPPPRSSGEALLADPLLAPMLDRIRDERSFGLAILVQQALQALCTASERTSARTCAEWLNDLRRTGRAVATRRPSLATLAHVSAQLLYEMELQAGQEPDLERLKVSIDQAANRIFDQYQADASRLADEISRLIPPGGVVMSFGYSVPFVEGLQRCKHFGVRVIAPEGRPGFDGRLLARAVLATGKSATVITDAAVGLAVQDADMVIVGADALLADGSVLYKTGAYPLALVARSVQVPFFVAATLSTLDLRPGIAEHLVLEEKSPSEVWDEHLPGLEVRNIRYENVPADLIAGVVTEDGVLEPSALEFETQSRDYLLAALVDR